MHDCVAATNVFPNGPLDGFLARLIDSVDRQLEKEADPVIPGGVFTQVISQPP
jgi:hypothetical protein